MLGLRLLGVTEKTNTISNFVNERKNEIRFNVINFV